MNDNARRTISKEKQEAIKRFLASNRSAHTVCIQFNEHIY